jgi:diacylglycerol kinase
MFNRLRVHQVSFRHAYDGFVYTVKTQPNFRFHLLATICAMLMGIYFQINKYEWLVLVFTVNMVLVAEMINTSIESIVDLVTLERRQDAKVAKDVSAGMVLVSAVLSVVVAFFLFLPKIIAQL